MNRRDFLGVVAGAVAGASVPAEWKAAIPAPTMAEAWPRIHEKLSFNNAYRYDIRAVSELLSMFIVDYNGTLICVGKSQAKKMGWQAGLLPNGPTDDGVHGSLIVPSDGPQIVVKDEPITAREVVPIPNYPPSCLLYAD